LSCKIKKIPYIVYIYSADILEFSRGIITRYIMNAVIKNSKAVVANSVFTKNLICSRIKSVEGKIIVSTPVVNPSGFKKDISIAEARGKLGLPPDKKVILTVARLSRRKGHDIMLEAVGKLIKERRDILYLIVGEGPMMGKLKKSVKKMFLSEYVRFCGRVCCDKLRYYYRASDLFCMIPRYMEKEGDSEGFGIVFLEAAGWGLPVVAGASGGVNEAVIDGETGILVDPENVELIKETILKLLNDVETSRVLGQNGRNRIREEFNIDDRVKVLMSVS
jgi:phosphatidylinositol alpha-1,6-mannosyltransferase